MSGPERRQHDRHATTLVGRINFAPGRVLNLSMIGALVETHEWVALGHRATLRLPEHAIQLPSVVVRCELVRVDSPEGRPVYEATLYFDDPHGVRQQLASLIGALTHEPVEPSTQAVS